MRINIGGVYYNIQADDCYFVIKEQSLKEDIITYTVDLENNLIHAKIEKPSQHTLYLIEQERCYMCLNIKTTKQWSKWRGTYSYGPDVRNDWHRGLQRTQHSYWTKTPEQEHVKVTNINSIELFFRIDTYSTKSLWHILENADRFHNPDRDSYYITFKPILVCKPSPNGVCLPNLRVYQSHSKETTLVFERE